MLSYRAKSWYGFAAPFYDFIKKLFYPRIVKITDDCISELPASKEILIVGGGTGSILSSFSKRFPDSNITFLDISEDMIALAKKKRGSRVSFICEDFFHFEGRGSYDLVFFPFFLDHFSQKELRVIAKRAHMQISNDGVVAIVDFHHHNKQLSLGIALKLARLLLGLSITKLEDSNPILAELFPMQVAYIVDENTEFYYSIRRKLTK